MKREGGMKNWWPRPGIARLRRLTPEEAIALACNPSPDMPSQPEEREVAFLAFAMDRGWWRPLCFDSAIVLDECGRVVQGMQKILAIVRHGYPVEVKFKSHGGWK